MEILKGERPMTFSEAAVYLNLSKSYLYKLTFQRLIPHFKPMGKKIYFKREDLETFLLRRPVPTTEALEQKAVNRLNLRKVAAR